VDLCGVVGLEVGRMSRKVAQVNCVLCMEKAAEQPVLMFQRVG